MFRLPHLALLIRPHRRTTPPVSPHYPFLAFLSHQTLSFTSVTFSGGGVSGPPSPLCRMYLFLPWVSESRVAALSLSHGSTLKAQICRLDHRHAWSVLVQPNQPTQPTDSAAAAAAAPISSLARCCCCCCCEGSEHLPSLPPFSSAPRASLPNAAPSIQSSIEDAAAAALWA